VGIGGIYYGTQLKASTYSYIFSSFYRFFRPSINIITHYFQGLNATPEKLYINIKHLDYQNLAYGVSNARNRGEITKSEKNIEVKGVIEHNGEKYDVKMKLRGMGLYHVRGDKWSFRIKISNNKTLFGMERFSLSSPETRIHIHEWLYQKALKNEGLINLRYKFVNVILNGKNLGIYALEEFFDKRLIENNQLREGIIVKPGINPENIKGAWFVYQEKRVLSDSLLKNSYDHLTNLVKLFEEQKLPAGSLFDIKKTAKYFAITTIFGGQHGHLGGNFICYFNPVTNLLEPIGYDSNVARILERYGGIITSKRNQYHETVFSNLPVLTFLFNSRDFYTAYIRELERIISNNYIAEFLNSIKDKLEDNLAILYKEYYYFDYFKRDYLNVNINYVKKQLLNDKLVKVQYLHYNQHDRIKLSIDNLSDIYIKVLGLMVGDNIIFKPNDETVIKSTLSTESYILNLDIANDKKVLKISDNEFFLAYQVYGLNKLLKAEVDDVPSEMMNYDSSAISNVGYYLKYKKSNMERFPFLNIEKAEGNIKLTKGHYVLTNDLIIPPNIKFFIESGVELDLLDSTNILSYSPIYFLGTENDSILIHSSDSTGQGIIILYADNESKMDHVCFSNLSKPARSGWNLTGSINFYESDISINNCLFEKNRSEDALNIIRSNYKISKSIFRNTASDAFDGDFSNGLISQSKFINCGNDAIDVSGGIVTIDSVFIDNAGDKGISIGESSLLSGKNIAIFNSEIGITSKDRSRVDLDNITISNTRLGFTAYQKKPEYGPGEIVVINYKLYNVDREFLIEAGSSMFANNMNVPATYAKVEEMLYGSLYGKSSR